MDAEAGDDGERVSLMTLHGAKGLEFNTVFLPGWEEGLFPHQRSLDENGLAGLEEERRLAHVGLTRARRYAIVSFTQNRRVHALWQSQIPSRFIDELPEDHVEVAESRGAYGMAGGGQTRSRFDEPGAGFQHHYETPGWQRAQAHWQAQSRQPRHADPRRGPRRTIEGELVAASSKHSSCYKVGDGVRHEKFGRGIVAEIDGNKLTVDFETVGRKRVVESFVRPE
jgi:DNA helicase-2/ATP-dependent DNA helicase PcrA